MSRIAGIDLPRNKRTVIALTYIHGIGRSTAKNSAIFWVCRQKEGYKILTEDEITRIRDEIEKTGIPIEGDLRRVEGLNVKRLIEINCYRGQRHRRGLPTRGQRTKTNARTRRGRKRVTVANKKIAPSKG